MRLEGSGHSVWANAEIELGGVNFPVPADRIASKESVTQRGIFAS